MTIYLYKKTHKVTGLQYLGKTVRDPFKYNGSGIKWCSHLRKHGYFIETEILRECSSIEELKEWGRYYSNLWNVVESSAWANLKPEEGQGFATGKYHHSHNPKHKLKASIRAKTRMSGDKNPMKDPEVIKKHWAGNNNPSCRPEVRKKKIGSNNGRFDHNLYHWKNAITGEIITSTRYDMIHNHQLNKNEIIKMINGKRTSAHMNWFFVTKP